MQKTKAKIPLMFIVLTVIAACVLHFFKLMQQAGQNIFSADTGALSYVLYVLLAVCTALSGLYASLKKNMPKTFAPESENRKLAFVIFLLSVSMFFDFIHQCFNCYDYVQRVSYVEYAYVIPMGVSGILALVCSFYFMTFALTYRNSNYDFRNFTWFHFSPILWAFVRMLMIMSRLVDIKNNFEICCEFLFLAALLGFMFCVISAIERNGESTTKFFVFSSFTAFSMAAVLVIPRMIMIIMGYAQKMESVTFSNITYIMLGVFAIALAADINRRKES